MEYVLSIPAEADMPNAADRASAASRPDPEENARRSYGGMAAAVEAVASEMRDRGLTVHVETTGGAGAGPAAPGGAGSTVSARPARVPAVPVPVAVAIAFAVREALANVASHAGTGEAWVEICPVAPDRDDSVPSGAGLAAGEPLTCPDGIRVTVRDAGAGFDPGQVDPSRLGLRRSIVERLADWGGRALIRSSPGAGTEVILSWAPPQDTSRAAGPGGSAALAGV
jgi:signal transduction histidine kinase